MTAQLPPSRQRLINAALELFASQGVTETTTRQIAEVAGVNEVTLFRQFGNKHGLLLAVMEEATVLSSLAQAWAQQANPVSSLEQALKDYADSRLEALEAIPELVRSLVGEAGQYPTANRQALGHQISQANRFVAQYLEMVIRQGQLQTRLPAEKIASLLNSLLLGYAVLDLTSEFHQLWRDRHDFLDSLIELFLHGAVAEGFPVLETRQSLKPAGPTDGVGYLPASVVHALLQQAKKLGGQVYALMYVLFAAGLTPGEIVILDRVHHHSEACAPPGGGRHQHLLQIPEGAIRQVPINQWILGKRYGSYTNNPLTQWLKSRKDQETALFINEQGQRISESDLQRYWQTCTQGLVAPTGEPPTLEQARQTWCVEMLVKGVKPEALSLLSGLTLAELEPYMQRANEKLALEQARLLDQKPGKAATAPPD